MGEGLDWHGSGIHDLILNWVMQAFMHGTETQPRHWSLTGNTSTEHLSNAWCVYWACREALRGSQMTINSLRNSQVSRDHSIVTFLRSGLELVPSLMVITGVSTTVATGEVSVSFWIALWITGTHRAPMASYPISWKKLKSLTKIKVT